MRLFSLTEFFTKAVEAFKRFPFALTWAVVGAITVIVILEDGERAFEAHSNLILIFVLGISWLIGAQFYIEQFKKKGLWWIKLVIVALLIAFYFTLPASEPGVYDTDDTPYMRWVLFSIAGHLALFFAPFFTVWHPKAYWNYISNIIIAIARSALFSGVLYLGLVLAMLAIQFLFDVEIDGKRYFQLFVVCLGIVNTWVYLSDFPKEIQHDIHMTFHKPIEVFVKFILIPLAGLYFVILYAYAVKILVLWELPKGWVSYLVTALAALLFIIQAIIHPVRLSHPSSVIRRFQPYFYWALLPLLPLLYVAIYRRIADYGVTEARYFLIVIAIFITVTTLYLLFSRKQQLRFLPMGLAVLIMVTSFGFWGAFSVSERSQLKQFDEVYDTFLSSAAAQDATPEQSGAKVTEPTTTSRETANRFVSIAQFLKSRDALAATETILGYNPTTAFPEASSWNIGDRILDSLGITIRAYQEQDLPRSFYPDTRGALEIKGYDYYQSIHMNNLASYNRPENIISGYRFSIVEDRAIIQVTRDQKQQLLIPLGAMIKELKSTPYNTGAVPQDRLTLVAENDTIAVKIFFTQLELLKKNEAYQINYCDANILLNLKQ